jgi:hypothetical protein
MTTQAQVDTLLTSIGGPSGAPATVLRQAQHAEEQARKAWAAAAEAHLFNGGSGETMMEREDRLAVAVAHLRRVEAAAELAIERQRRTQRDRRR